MLSRTYEGALRVERTNYLPDYWQQLQIVVIAGVTLYRKTEPQPKCKRCRNVHGKIAKRRKGLGRHGAMQCPSVGGECCPSCGNPFIYTHRMRSGAKQTMKAM